MENKFCPKCGNKLENSVNFCTKCGYNLNENTVNAAPIPIAYTNDVTSVKKPRNKKKIKIISIVSGAVVIVGVAVAFILSAFFVPDYTGMTVQEMKDKLSTKFYSATYTQVYSPENDGFIYEQSIEPGTFNFSCDKIKLISGTSSEE